MREHTMRLVRHPQLLAEMSVRAAQVDARFGVGPFLDAVEQVVDESLAGG